MVRHMNKLGIDQSELSTLMKLNAEILKKCIQNYCKDIDEIQNVMLEEKSKFMKTLVNGEQN